MKNEYNHMMEQFTLSQDTRCAIEKRLAENHVKKKSTVRPFFRFAAVFSLLLVLVTTSNPMVARALERTVTRTIQGIRALAQNHWIDHDTSCNPSGYLKENNGRLIFRCNLEIIDITDVISMDNPFTYIYTVDGIIHYIAVGGDYDPETGLDGVGYCEWLRDANKMEAGIAEGDIHAGWLGGNGGRIHYDSETGTHAVWYAKAIIEMDIPWGSSEAEALLEELEIKQEEYKQSVEDGN